jgi:mRNA interferase YafQ
MLKPEFTGQFKKDYKLAIKRGCKQEALQEVITLLVNEQPLPDKYRKRSIMSTLTNVRPLSRSAIDYLLLVS